MRFCHRPRGERLADWRLACYARLSNPATGAVRRRRRARGKVNLALCEALQMLHRRRWAAAKASSHCHAQRSWRTAFVTQPPAWWTNSSDGTTACGTGAGFGTEARPSFQRIEGGSPEHPQQQVAIITRRVSHQRPRPGAAQRALATAWLASPLRRQARQAAVASGEDASRPRRGTNQQSRHRSRRSSTKRWPASAGWM